MVLPSQLVLRGCGFAGDGGTIRLDATDERNVKHEIVLTQHAYHYTRDPRCISGRLYFDGEIVPIRSALETGIVALLRAAELRSQNESALRAAVREVTEFVDSPRYLSFAAEQEANGHAAPDQ